MPYRICKTFDVENGHMLSKHPDKCQFPHGHSRKVECVLEADALDENEMVCDFKVVREIMHAFLERFDHALCMNTEDPMFATLQAAYGERIIGFQGTDPTTEVMAKSFYDHLTARLKELAQSGSTRYPIRASLRVVKVRLWETSSSWAEYFE